MYPSLVGAHVKDIRDLHGRDAFIGAPSRIPDDLDASSLTGLLGGRVFLASGHIFVCVDRPSETSRIAADLVQVFTARAIPLTLHTAKIPAADLISLFDMPEHTSLPSWATPTHAYRIEPNDVERRLGLFAADHILSSQN